MRSGKRGKVWQRALIGASPYAIQAASAFFINLAAIGAAMAQPTGGTVVAGQATIANTGATTLVTQSTSKAIINWQDFSVAAGSTVQFAQPGSSSITLNRVTGSTASAINGSLLANGQVWILNSNGVLFGQGSSINVGGLLATTSDIANNDFLSGNYSFTGGNGTIVNNGTIQAKRGGSVVLSAPTVANHSLIKATAGHVVLAGTDTFTVDFNGDHLLSYAVGPTSKTGSVTNSGAIKAAGGQVLMTARAASGVADGVINNTGMVEATSARKGENGEIILDAGDGTAETSGTLDASGKKTGTTGGTVEVLGQTVTVADNAKIDVSGDAGGGTALIGGNFKGAGPQANAVTTTVGKATIKADAINSGNGGKVAVYSTGTTTVAASISAKGGATGGNGGQVETSGHNLGISNDATVLTGAVRGAAGAWLLDPDYIVIATGGTAPDTGQTFSTTGTVTIAPSAVAASLAAGSNVDLQANVDITVSNAISATSENSLTLDAGHSVILNAGLTITGGSIVLIASDAAGSGHTMPSPAISAAGGVSLTATTVSLTNSLGSIGLVTAPLGVNAPTLNVTSGVNASIQSTGSINIAAANVTGSFFLNAPGAITQSGAVTAGNLSVTETGSGTIALTNTGNVIQTLSVTTDAVAASVTSTGALSVTGANVGSSTLSLQTTGGITQTAAITAGQLNLTAGAAIVLGSANLFSTLQIGTAGFAASVTNTNDTSLSSINLNVGFPGTPGSFTLAAPGKAVTQTGSINVQDLNVQAATIALGSGSNTIYGTARFTSTGNTSYYNGSGPTETVLGNSSVGGALTVNSYGTIALSDASGIVSVTGLASFNSTNGSISQTIPLSAGSLSATVTNNGGITLDNGSNSVTGAASFTMPSSGGTGASFSNSLDTTIGASSITNGDFTIASSGGLTFSGAITVSAGDLILSAAGPITQSAALTAQGLNATTTGTGGDITLDDANNAFSSIVHFNTTAGSVSFANSINTELGSSAVTGDLDVEAVNNGQTLQLDGAQGDVVAVSGLLVMHAGGDITQLIPLNAGSLAATSDTGAVNLSFDDTSNMVGNIVTGTVTADGNDTVGGVVNLSGVGVVDFTNHAANTVVGAVSVSGNSGNTAAIDIEALDPYGVSGPHANLYLNSSITAQTTNGVNAITGDTVLHSSGDMVNLGARSSINGDALILNSDYGNIGGAEPNGSSSNFMASDVASMSIFLGTAVGGDGTGQGASISNAVNYIIGTDQGGINAGTAGAVLLGGGNGAIVTQHGGPTDQSGIDGSIVAGSLSMAPNGGYTLDNAGNAVGTFRSHSPGAGIFVNSTALALGQVDGNLFDNGNGMTPSGDFTVSAQAGDITQNGEEMTIGGVSTFNARSGNIVLDGAANNITGPVTLHAGQYNAQIPGQGLLTFNNAAATTVLTYAGALNSDSTQVAASDINIHVTGSLSLAGSVLSATSASVIADGGMAEAYQGLIEAPSITLGSTSGAIGSSSLLIQLDSSSSSDLNLTINTAGQNAFVSVPAEGASISGINLQGSAAAPGNLFLNAGGNVSQTGAITSAGLAIDANGGDISLQNESNAVSGTVQFTTGAQTGATLISTTGLSMGDSNVQGDLNVTAGGDVGVTGNVMVSNTTTLTTTGAINLSGNLTSQSDITLSAGTGISQTAGSIAQSTTTTPNFTAISTLGSIALSSPLNAITGVITMQAPGDITLFNMGETNLLSIDNGVDGNQNPIAANSVTLNIAQDGNGFADIFPQFSGRGVAANSVSLTTAGGSIGNVEGYLNISGGNDNANATTVSVSTAGGSAYLYAYSPVTLAGASLGSGSMTVFSGGNIQVTGPVTSLNGTINLDAQGSIQINGDVSADDPSSTSSGSLSLTANDGCAVSYPCVASSDTSGIFTNGSALISAGTLTLNVDQGPDGISGGIGAPSAPLLINTYNQAGAPIAFSADTYSGDAYFSSAKGVSFNELDLSAPSVLDQNGNPIRGSLLLVAAGPITQTYGITVKDLTLATSLVSAPITMNGSGCSDCQGNTVTGIAHFDTQNGDVTFASAATLNLGASNINGNLTVGAFDPNNFNAQILIADPNGGVMHASGSVFLSADTDVVQGQAYAQNTGTLDATNAIALETGALDIENGAAIELTHSANKITGAITLTTNSDPTVFNSVDTILGATSVLGDLDVQSAGSLTVTGAVSANLGSVTLTANGGDLTLASGASIASIGGSSDNPGPDTIVLAASGNFLNNSSAGASVLSPGAGYTWKIYSAAPAADVFGGLDSGNTAIWDTAYTTPVSQTGDRYVFAFQPTLTLSTASISKVYGTDTSAVLQQQPITVSGLQPGVPGAFLGDSAAIYSGTPVVASAGTAAGVGVGVYAIAIAGGNFTNSANYAVAVSANSVVTVTPATLTYTANAANGIYGQANGAFSGTVSGFVNGDTQTSATSGTLAFTSPATAASNVGSYAINGSGLSASNYVFVQAAGNATALTINPATLMVVANMASRIYGQANGTLAGSVTGFVNGDTQASATTGTLTFTSSATAGSNVGRYAVNGSGLSAGNYNFVQAAGNATALTVNPATLTYVADAANRVYGQANGALSGTVTGFVNGDTLGSATTGALAFASSATPGSDVGRYAIAGSGLNAGNYIFVQAAGNATALTINPATLTIALTGTVSKIYDGSTAATLNAFNYTSLAGIFGSDNVALAFYPTTGSYDTAEAGAGKTVTVSGLSLTGSKAANYIIANSISGAVGVIDAVATSLLDAKAAAALRGFTAAFTAQPPASPTPTTLPAGAPPSAALTSVLVASVQAANQSTEPPSLSDQTSSYVSQSLDGGAAADIGSAAGGVIIPHFLVAHPAAPSAPLAPGALPSWGNAGLWQ